MKKASINPVIIAALAFGLAPLISCGEKEESKGKAVRLPTVTVIQPKEENIERIISTIGTIELEDKTRVATEVAGLVKEVRFIEGQEVSPDEILAVLDQVNFKLSLDRAETALDKASSIMKLAEDNYKRAKILHEKDLISDQEYQESATVFENALLDVSGAQVNFQGALRAFESSAIKAPFDKNNKARYIWEVQNKLVSVGEYLSVGSPVAELVNRTRLKIRFVVPEREAGYLAQGKVVRFSVPALPGRDFEAKIFYIAPNAAENTRSVTAKAYFDNADMLLRAGYSANVRFVADIRDKALVIPRRSLRFDTDNIYVLLVQDGTLYKKSVSIGVEKDDYVEVVSGLSLSDTVVVRSGSFLEDGAKVEIVVETTAPPADKPVSSMGHPDGQRNN